MAKLSVPIKDYTDAAVSALRWQGIIVAIGFMVAIAIIDNKNGKAIEVGFAAADAKGLQHNGVIEYFRQLLPKFITWQSVMSFLTALGICAAVYAVFLK